MNRDRAWMLLSVLLAIGGAVLTWSGLSSDSSGGYASGVLLVWLGIAGALSRPSALGGSDAAVGTAGWILGVGGLLALVAWVVAPQFRGGLVQELGLGAMLFGAMAIWLGYTRRIGADLVCRACGYGIDAEEPPRRCPECGVELWPRGAMARGTRARHPHLMGVGAACVVLGLASVVPELRLGIVGLMPTSALVGMGAAHTLDRSGYAELATRTLSTWDADRVLAAILGASGNREPSPAEADWIIAAVSSVQLVGQSADRGMLAVVRPRLRVSTVEAPKANGKQHALVLFECEATSERARDVFVAIGSPPNTWSGMRTMSPVVMSKRIASGMERQDLALAVMPGETRVTVPIRVVVLPSNVRVPEVTANDAQGRPSPLSVETWGMDLELWAPLTPQLPSGR